MADTGERAVSVRERVQQIAGGYSLGQKIIFVLTLVSIIALFFFMLRWATRPEYVALYSDMDLKDGDRIVEILQSEGVPHRLSDGGKAILVPSTRVHELRMKLAGEGLPRSGNIGFEVFDKKEIGVSEFVQSVNYQRALEGELGRTIQALSEVQYARVHLVFPKERLFKEDQQQPTASVLLQLKPNARLTEGQVHGIANLTANSVEGLSYENVTIVNTDGDILTRTWERGSDVGLSDSQLELQKKVEEHLQHKAQTMLDGVLGTGNSVVRVSAALNFQKIDRMDETYDPDNTAVLSEEITEESSSDTAGKPVLRSEHSVTNYNVNKTVQHIVESVGDIQRLSLAVLVDGTYRETTGPAGETASEYVPRTPEELTMLELVVKNAVGFSEQRGDQFEMNNVQFDTSGLTDHEEWLDAVAKKEQREFYVSIAQKVVVGILLVVLLLFVFSRLRRVKTSILPAGLGYTGTQSELQSGERFVPSGPALDENLSAEGKERLTLQQQVSQFAEQKPDVAARLIRYWLHEDNAGV